MNSYKAQELIDKYEQGLCNAEEKALVESWFIDSLNKSEGFEGELDYEQKEAEIWSALPAGVREGKKVRLWPRVAVAAAAVAAITLGVWSYTLRHIEGSAETGDLFANDVAPGKNTATLTLADGKTINLSGAKTGVVITNDRLAYNDGSNVEKHYPELVSGSRAGKAPMLSASTPRGGTYQVTLPDGTHVWLNADSKISFPSQFSGSIRKVLLSGEAYFEVTKNKKMPFTVESNGQEVEVLGTHFNINAYNDEGGTKTTLLEGSVKVTTLSSSFTTPSFPASSLRGGTTKQPHDEIAPHTKGSVVLKPNQQSIISGYNRITVNDVDVTEVIDWKNDEFRFNDLDLKSIMRKVSRWYNIDVVYDGDIPQQKLDGVVSRTRNISQVLKMLEKTGNVCFKIEGNKVFVRSNMK